MKKQILTILLSLTIILSFVPLSASAYSDWGQCGDNVYWMYDEENQILYLEGEGEMWNLEHYHPHQDHAPDELCCCPPGEVSLPG